MLWRGDYLLHLWLRTRQRNLLRRNGIVIYLKKRRRWLKRRLVRYSGKRQNTISLMIIDVSLLASFRHGLVKVDIRTREVLVAQRVVLGSVEFQLSQVNKPALPVATFILISLCQYSGHKCIIILIILIRLR
jgi:uncharacterized protein YqgQ